MLLMLAHRIHVIFWAAHSAWCQLWCTGDILNPSCIQYPSSVVTVVWCLLLGSWLEPSVRELLLSLYFLFPCQCVISGATSTKRRIVEINSSSWRARKKRCVSIVLYMQFYHDAYCGPWFCEKICQLSTYIIRFSKQTTCLIPLYP